MVDRTWQVTTFSVTSTLSVLNVTKYSSFFPPGAVEILEFVDFIIIFTIISVFGIIANVVNIVVFIKMGTQDTINISLLGLSLADFFFLLLTFLLSICYYPFWQQLDLNFSIIDMKLLTVGWPQFYFRRVSNWITAFIMFERCICIALPLKVKNIITPRRTVAILVVIHVIMALAISPPYFSTSYQARYDATKNRTMIVFVFHDNSPQTDAISSVISLVFTVVTFVWVIVCTFILVVNLRNKAKWRQERTLQIKSENVSTRDRKVIKMVTILSIIFIVSFTPDVIALFYIVSDYRVSVYGDYFDLWLTLNGFSETMLAISASVNIFVYFSMSSKFREIYCRYFIVHRI